MFDTIKVLVDFEKEYDENDKNEFSGMSFATTCLLLVVNMFANDLNIPLEYSNVLPGVNQKEYDIFISFQDSDNVYDVNRVTSVWPHYQNRYCFVYANAKATPSLDISFSSFSSSNALVIAFWAFWMYHCYVLYAR